MSDELPSSPRRTEKLHSFNKEAGFQLLLKGQKKITFLHELDSVDLRARGEKKHHYSRDETLFLLRGVIGWRQHCSLVCGF